MNFLFKVIIAVFSVALCSGEVAAQVITEYRGGIEQAFGSGNYFGQSFTISTNGSYSDVTFNFYSNTANTATAPGTLFLYTAPYNGSVTQLGSASATFLKSAVGANNLYSFTGLNLSSGIQYFAYSNANGPEIRYTVSNGYAGGQSYQAEGTTNPYFELPPVDVDFTVTAVVAAAPEPAAWTLMIIGFGAVGGTMRRRQRKGGSIRSAMLAA